MSAETLWVCAACSKVGFTRLSVGDESCYLHAVECWASSVVLRGNGDNRATYAVVATTDWVEPASFTVWSG